MWMDKIRVRHELLVGYSTSMHRVSSIPTGAWRDFVHPPDSWENLAARKGKLKTPNAHVLPVWFGDFENLSYFPQPYP